MNIHKNEFFKEATIRICSTLNLDSALERLLDYVQSFIPLDSIMMGIYDPTLNIGQVVAYASIKSDKKEDPLPIIQLPSKHWDKLKAIWNTRDKLTIINDLDKEEPDEKEIITHIYKDDNISLLNMSLELDQEKVGSVSFRIKGKNQYTDEHAKLISLLHDPITIAMSNTLKHMEVLRLKDMITDDNQYLQRQLLQISGDTIIGSDFGLKNVMEMIRQVAPMDSPVLLLGETGVGKEVIANALHYSSTRKDGPFIKVNCGAIQESLIDSELFGHEKGSFTGAISQKRGRFERAHTGTIFLDEIGELPLPAQVRLLRVLQNKEIERVGGTETINIDTRIISATNQNLEELVKKGQFREDLWFRLNVFPIIIPPLRQRKEDIPALVHHFVGRKSNDLKINEHPALDSSAIARLKEYHWPGNVRELENLVERELIKSIGQTGIPGLSFQNLGRSLSQTDKHVTETGSGSLVTMDEIITGHIKDALALTKGKIEGEDGAAALLDMHPSTLRGKMRKLGISYGRKQK